jgi:hypothetical protein
VLDRLIEGAHAAEAPTGPAVLVVSSLYDDDIGLRLEATSDPADLMV